MPLYEDGGVGAYYGVLHDKWPPVEEVGREALLFSCKNTRKDLFKVFYIYGAEGKGPVYNFLALLLKLP